MKLIARRLASSELMIWLLLCVIGIYFLYPLRKSLRFGIDLVGGTYLTLEVQTDKAIEAELLSKLQSIDSKLKRERSLSLISKTIANEKITLTFENQNQAQEASRILKTDQRDLVQSVDKNTISKRKNVLKLMLFHVILLCYIHVLINSALLKFL